MIGKGRKQIFTPYKYIDDSNIIEVIQAALANFNENASDCEFLIDYKDGMQPVDRSNCPKKVMPWINCEAIDNVAKEVYDFWKSFGWGNPISLVQRGDVEESSEIAEGIKQLNNQYTLSGNLLDCQELAKYIECTGVGYTFIDINTEWEDDESFFTRDVMSPMSTAVVRSSYYTDKRVMLGFTVRKDEDNNRYYTAFTKDRRYDIYQLKKKSRDGIVSDEWGHESYSGIKNPLGKIPIIEWIRDVDRTGVFEAQVAACDNLNLQLSDIMNGTDQNVQAVWWANNVEFPKQEVKDDAGNVSIETVKPKQGDWVTTKSPKDGAAPSIKALTIDYHLTEMQNNYLSQRRLILEKCHVPMRNSTSGGSSGVAMDSASGWDDAENVASSQENLTQGCQMNEVKVVLAAIRESVGVTGIEIDNPMLGLKASQITPSIRRPKNYELTNRVNAWAAVVAKGGSVEDALTVAPIVPDAAQFIARSGEGIRKYQEAQVWQTANSEKAAGQSDETHMTDLSDERQNTPLIDGMTTYSGEIEENGED